MTEEEKTQAAAYIKLQDDVRKLIVDTIYAELMNYGSPLYPHIRSTTLYSNEFKEQVKNVVKEQMNKY